MIPSTASLVVFLPLTSFASAARRGHGGAGGSTLDEPSAFSLVNRWQHFLSVCLQPLYLCGAQDMAVLVEAQGEMLDNIEAQVPALWSATLLLRNCTLVHGSPPWLSHSWKHPSIWAFRMLAAFASVVRAICCFRLQNPCMIS